MATDWTLPSGALRQNMPRLYTNLNTGLALPNAQLFITGIPVGIGDVITSVTYYTSVSVVNPTNQWVVLMDDSRNQLALGTDATNTGWSNAGTGAKSFSVSYTVTQDRLMLVGLCVVTSAGTQPTLRSFALGTAAITGVAPILNGTSSSGLTNPASCPNPAGAITATTTVPYFHLN